MRRTCGESKDKRIQKRLDFISELYNLIFDNNDIKNLKQDLKFINNEKELVMCCKKIAEQIRDFQQKSNENSRNSIYVDVTCRLKAVFVELASLIKDEFRTVRTRNNRIPQLDL